MMAIPTWSDEQKKKLGLDNFLLETVEKKTIKVGSTPKCQPAKLNKAKTNNTPGSMLTDHS